MLQFLPLFFALVGSVQAELSSWLTSVLPQRGNGTFQDGLECYSLPYGGIGFASYILSYWMVGCLYYTKRPMRPTQYLKKGLMDIVLGAFSLLGTLALSALATIRCRFNWPFVLIAVWKMIFSLWVTCTAIHRALDVWKVHDKERAIAANDERRYERYQYDVRQRKVDMDEAWSRGWLPWIGATTRWATTFQPSCPQRPPLDSDAFGYKPLLWLGLYACGVIIGLVGLITVVVNNWSGHTKAMNIVCGLFGGCVVLIPILVFLVLQYMEDEMLDNILGSLFVLVVIIGVLTALWSDWILAAISVRHGGNWSGVPSSGVQGLYWGYFAAKRLPLLFT